MGTGRRRPSGRAGLLAILVGVATAASAYETDQYSHRLVPITDSGEILSDLVNDALAEVAAEWRGPPDPLRFARRVYAKLGGLHWVDRIERQAMRDPRVDRLPQTRYQSIYRGAPVTSTRVNFFFGIGRTLKIAGSLVGSDKLGHFFSQGYKYYRRHRAGRTEAELLARGRYAERWLFGQLTTGVFSNADLVANYEGYLFYRSLFEDGPRPALVRWREGGPVLTRRFDWADHINDYWDEATHPSWFSPGLSRYMRRALPDLCSEYAQAPDRYRPREAEALARRYAVLDFRPAPQFRMDAICRPTGVGPTRR